MKVLVYFPIDTLVKSWARRLEADGHEVRTVHSFADFRRGGGWADWILMNSAKYDSSKYIWKILFSLRHARRRGWRVALFFSIDPVDLCDRPLLRRLLLTVNRMALGCPQVVAVLETREHVVRRYQVPEDRVLYVHNVPDRKLFAPVTPPAADESSRTLTFFYHGELLWWHGLERFVPIYEELNRRRPARLIVAGTLYPTVFRVMGLTASRKEARIKRELAGLIERDDVEYCGRVDVERLRQIMSESDFHATQFNDEDMQARTELRTCLLEAMAAGMVCLHAPTPALMPRAFQDGRNIVTIDPRDPSAAAEKILALAASPDKLNAIRRSAIKTVNEHFDFDTYYRNLLTRMESWEHPTR